MRFHHCVIFIPIMWASGAIGWADAQPNLPRMTKEDTVWEDKQIPNFTLIQKDAKPIEALLNNVSDAQIYLHRDEISGVKTQIEQALDNLNKVSELDRNDNSRVNRLDFMAYGFRKALEVRMPGDLLPTPAILPVGTWDDVVATQPVATEDPPALTVADIAEAIDRKGLTEDQVRDMEVRYVGFDVDYVFTQSKLNDALAHLQKGDYIAAQFDLLQTQIAMLENRNRILIPERMQAKDSISLSRYLLNNNRYDAARRALDDAIDAVGRIDNVPDPSDATIDAEKIAAQMRDLKEKINDENSSSVKEVDQKLEALWMQLT